MISLLKDKRWISWYDLIDFDWLVVWHTDTQSVI